MLYFMINRMSSAYRFKNNTNKKLSPYTNRNAMINNIKFTKTDQIRESPLNFDTYSSSTFSFENAMKRSPMTNKTIHMERIICPPATTSKIRHEGELNIPSKKFHVADVWVYPKSPNKYVIRIAARGNDIIQPIFLK